MQHTKHIIVMGVSGCGKSTIAGAIAKHYGLVFLDGDDFHPEENIQKMQSGTPLNDDDRQGWLETLNQTLINHVDGAVLACSSLKQSYRDTLVRSLPDAVFVYLQGDFDTIWQRHQARQGHYFNGKSMLEDQFKTLEEPHGERVISIDVSASVENIVASAITGLNGAAR